MIVHIVSLAYKPSANRQEVRTRFTALLHSCVKGGGRTAEGPYIVSLQAGSQNSGEGLTRGIEDIFVLQFAGKADRDYYVDEDPVHRDFKRWLIEEGGADLSASQISDFEVGSFV